MWIPLACQKQKRDSKCWSDLTVYVRWNVPLVWQNVMVILSCSTNFGTFLSSGNRWTCLQYQQSRLNSNFVSKRISSLENQLSLADDLYPRNFSNDKTSYFKLIKLWEDERECAWLCSCEASLKLCFHP